MPGIIVVVQHLVASPKHKKAQEVKFTNKHLSHVCIFNICIFNCILSHCPGVRGVTGVDPKWAVINDVACLHIAYTVALGRKVFIPFKK